MGAQPSYLFYQFSSSYEELDGAIFHTMEIMQAARIDEKTEPIEVKMSIATKMVASEMLGINPRQD